MCSCSMMMMMMFLGHLELIGSCGQNDTRAENELMFFGHWMSVG